ncbi:MAG: hypothetical protein ABJF88_17565 [Rhodothermales bacterium]
MNSHSEADVLRVLEWYEKDPGIELVGEEALRGIGLDELLALFTPFVEDPVLFYKYEVGAKEAEMLQRAVQHQIDLGTYDYLIAAYQKSS